MFLGTNLQLLRRRNTMTQEILAQRLGVSRQAISKWESGEAIPEMHTLLQLADLFSCGLDELLRQDLSAASSPVRIVRVKAFRMVQYTMISPRAQQDVQDWLVHWAADQGLMNPSVLLWSFPYVTGEQKTRFSLNGFSSACILPPHVHPQQEYPPVCAQPDCTYALLTMEEPGGRSSDQISLGIRTILGHLQKTGIQKTAQEGILPCFERHYRRAGVPCVDIFLQCRDAAATEEMKLS